MAIPGLKTDGHEFIDDALARGARFIIHERDFTPPAGVTAIRVRDSRRVLGRLGRNFFGHPSASLCLIAVVGTNGKTTITYLLEAILRAAGHSVGVLGTVNYRYGEKHFPAPNTTPESFEMQRILREMADHGVTHVVAEVSSHAIALRRVDDCAFDLGIFTNLTQDHLDYHGTMENYFRAKKTFFYRGPPRRRKESSPADDPQRRRPLGSADHPAGRGRPPHLRPRQPLRRHRRAFRLLPRRHRGETPSRRRGTRHRLPADGKIQPLQHPGRSGGGQGPRDPQRGHPERDRRAVPGSGTPGEGQRGGATRRFCRLRPHGRRPAAGPPESFRLPDGEDHHRLRVRRGPGPREEAAHGRGRDRLQRSHHRDLGQPADGGSPGDHPGDRNGHPGAEILRYRGM